MYTKEELERRRAKLSEKKQGLLKKRLRGEAVATQKQKTRLIPKRPPTEVAPLSFAQQRLWFLHQLEPNSTVYNEVEAVRLTGPLDVEALAQSFTEIIRRHEILRTVFTMVDEQPGQKIEADVNWDLEMLDLSHLDAASQDARVLELVKTEGEHIFHLNQGHRPWLIKGIHLNSENHVILLVMHHIICDGWSIGVFIKELITLYNAYANGKSSPLMDLPIQYADFSYWQRQYLQGEKLEKDVEYWQGQLQNLTTLQLPTDYPRPLKQTFEGKSQRFLVPLEITERLNQLGQAEEVTLFMILLGAFQTLLYRYTGQTDIVVGSPIANRNRTELESLIGFFVNTLALRCDLSANPTFRALLKRVRDTTLAAYQYQDLPFELLVERLQISRDMSRTPVFQVVFILQNMPSADGITVAGLSSNKLDFENETAKFDLTLGMVECDEGICATIEYNTNLFSQSTIDRFQAHFLILIENISKNPDYHLADIPILPPSEQEQLLVNWNKTQQPYPETCLHDIFAAQVRKTPNNIAFDDGTHKLTYRQLDKKANQLARHLQTLGVGPDILVCVYMNRSVNMTLGLLAVLKAGGAYVPLDPDYPKGRLAFMLQDTKARILLTQESLAGQLPSYTPKTVSVDADWEIISKYSTTPPPSDVCVDNLAYVIYTSGSTGHPKGVAIQHGGVANLVNWYRRSYKISSNDRCIQIAGSGFDAVVYELWCHLTGSTIYMVDAALRLDVQGLYHWLIRNKITVAFLPTPLAEAILSMPWPDKTHLRLLTAGGDKLNKFLPVGASFDLVNLYGPTENTVISTSALISEANDTDVSPSIGRPIDNVQVYVLDNYLQLAPIGVVGELYIAGPGLARGYFNRPDLTAIQFVPNPFSTTGGERLYKTGDLGRYRANGDLMFLGRIDHQIKIRGFRIELGEIEANLSQYPDIAQFVVIPRDDDIQGKYLVAYLVLEKGKTLDINELRNYLKESLPHYMVPTAYVFLKAFPLTPNGKIDREALMKMSVTLAKPEVAFVSPENTTQKRIAEVYANLLNLERVSIYDNLFEIGGHSLVVVQLARALQEVFKIELPLAALFQFPTVAELAVEVDRIKAGVSDAQINRLDLEVEAQLSEDISPPYQLDEIPVPKNIFLTGATGFLGAYLLYELLKEMPEATIYCLIRAKDQSAALNRVRKNLASYNLWRDTMTSQIVPIVGNLSKPLLGLAPEKFDELATEMDLIYHNAASINLLSPYEILKKTNVFGTQEILRLACSHKVQPLHYVSTLSVFDSLVYEKREQIKDGEALGHPDTILGAYPKSKWVAEKMVTTARERGLPTVIYRPGRVTGDQISGIWQTNDFSCQIIKGCLQLEAAPTTDIMIDLTPVDYVAQAMVALSKQTESFGETFHMVNPSPMHWHDIVNWFQDKGYSIKVTDYVLWREKLANTPDNALYPLLHMFAFRTPEDQKAIDEQPPKPRHSHYGTENTIAHLAKTDITCPPVGSKLLDTYLSYLIDCEFIPPP